MKHEIQVDLIRRALQALESGIPPLSASFTRNDPRAYFSPERAAREREILFRRFPMVAGFSSQVKSPGDYFADPLSPVPILVVRNHAGELRAFANLCRHRGARLARMRYGGDGLHLSVSCVELRFERKDPCDSR